jgi:hypothetical protein
MKTTWTVLFSLLLWAAPAAVQAQFTNTNSDGSIYVYSTNAAGSCTIEGYAGPPWAVAIPTNINGLTVTGIGDDAFWGCPNLASVTIPGSATDIEDNAFLGCSDLSNVTIPDSVTNIGAFAFDDTGLTNVTIPASVASMGQQAFGDCANLTSVTIPGNNTASPLTDVFIGSANLTNVAIDNGVTSIGVEMFADWASLTSVTIPGSVTNIGDVAFISDSSLTSVAISAGVTSLGMGMFDDCTGLTNITIPGSVTNIRDGAFAYCTNLASVYFQGNAPTAATNVLHSDNKATVYYLPGTTNWGATFGGRPAMLWNPQAQTSDGSFGVSNNQFGFNITGTTNIPIVVDACTDLSSPVWTPLQALALTNGSFYFSDPQWTNFPGRYYRIRSP